MNHFPAVSNKPQRGIFHDKAPDNASAKWNNVPVFKE